MSSDRLNRILKEVESLTPEDRRRLLERDDEMSTVQAHRRHYARTTRLTGEEVSSIA